MDLEVVIVSHRDEHWLEPCIESLESAAGACAYRATIVENGGASISLPESPTQRVLYMPNLGFGAANNFGARGSPADFILFLNPDTELSRGSLERLVRSMSARPEVGLFAVQQVTSEGRLWPSLYRFPSLRRELAQALASEKWPCIGKRLGERVLDLERYSKSGRFDWTTGAVLGVRREAFESVGGFDERFFLFSEETDLCKRIQEDGWEARMEPTVTFVHHAGKAGLSPPREAQMAYARLQYARKHFSGPGAAAYRAVLLMHHLLRLVALRFRGPTGSSSAPASALALKVLLGRSAPPFRPSDVDSVAAPNGASPRVPREVTIMGLPFHGFDQPGLIRAFVDGARAGRGGWLVTPNLDILRQFATDPASRDLVLAATHRVADGLPIVWASRLAGAPIPERVPGSDLVVTLSEAAARIGLPVFLLGGNPGVADTGAAQLEGRFPGLRVGSHCPPVGFEDDPEELERIRKALRTAQPALVLVGLGFPKQERLIRLLRAEFPGAWFVGVGISLSFLAGEQPRAPVMMQRLGLEWVHRLWHEPRRLFRRYVVQGLPFALRLFAWALGQRFRAASTDL